MNYQSPAKAAEKVGKSRRWIVARCKENKLPFIRESGRYLIDIDKLKEAFEAMEAASINKTGALFSHENGTNISGYRL